MKSIKIGCLLPIFLLFLGACDTDNYKYFNEEGKTALHFNVEGLMGDSLVIGLRKYDADSVEINLPVELEGYAMQKDRQYRVVVDNDSTTAIEGSHYKILKELDIFRANLYQDTLKLVLHKNGPDLNKISFRLYLRLVPSDDFNVGLIDKSYLDIRFSNMLVKPLDWDRQYYLFFGEYSRVKHEIIMREMGWNEIPDNYPGGAYGFEWDAYGRAMNKYFTEHQEYDENGKLIQPWL